MGLQIDRQSEMQIFRIDGELDALEVQEIRPELEAAIQADVVAHVVDACELSLVDSSGIGLLVYLYKQAKANSKVLSLVGLQGQPADMISFLKIDQVVPVYASLGQARSALSGD